MLDAVLLDLDGTMLPMDTDYFVEVYFKYLFEDAYAWGYTDSELLEKGVRTGLKAMYKNDGSMKCSAAFWKAFSEVVHKDPTDDVKKFETFYATNFNKAKFVAKENPYVQETLEVARKKALAVEVQAKAKLQQKHLPYPTRSLKSLSLSLIPEELHFP